MATHGSLTFHAYCPALPTSGLHVVLQVHPCCVGRFKFDLVRVPGRGSSGLKEGQRFPSQRDPIAERQRQNAETL